MELTAIIQNVHFAQDRYVVSVKPGGYCDSIEELVEKERVELAVLVDATRSEERRFRAAFERKLLDNRIGFSVVPLPHYHGGNTLVALPDGWEVFNPPDTHKGSEALYLAQHRARGLLLQGFEPYKQSTQHMHKGDNAPSELKEEFWSLHGQFFNMVDGELHVLSRDSRAVFELKDGRLYHRGREFKPDTQLPLQPNSIPLRVYANQIHQAGTGSQYSLALLWMADFMKHDPCKRDSSIQGLIRAYQF